MGTLPSVSNIRCYFTTKQLRKVPFLPPHVVEIGFEQFNFGSYNAYYVSAAQHLWMKLPITNFANVFCLISTLKTFATTQAYRITHFSLAFPLFLSTLSALSTIGSSIMEYHSFHIIAFAIWQFSHNVYCVKCQNFILRDSITDDLFLVWVSIHLLSFHSFIFGYEFMFGLSSAHSSNSSVGINTDMAAWALRIFGQISRHKHLHPSASQHIGECNLRLVESTG